MTDRLSQAQFAALEIAAIYGLQRVDQVALNGRVRRVRDVWTSGGSITSCGGLLTITNPDRPQVRHATVERLIERGFLRVKSAKKPVHSSCRPIARRVVLTPRGRAAVYLARSGRDELPKSTSKGGRQ